MRNTERELTPVVYDDAAVKILHFHFSPGKNCFRTHWHERMELLRIREGELRLRCGGREKTAIAGEVAVFPPRTVHWGESGENGNYQAQERRNNAHIGGIHKELT